MPAHMSALFPFNRYKCLDENYCRVCRKFYNNISLSGNKEIFVSFKALESLFYMLLLVTLETQAPFNALGFIITTIFT